MKNSPQQSIGDDAPKGPTARQIADARAKAITWASNNHAVLVGHLVGPDGVPKPGRAYALQCLGSLIRAEQRAMGDP
jgi:hypothetical protein